MRGLFLLAVVTAISLVGCGDAPVSPERSESPSPAADATLVGDYLIGQPITHANLTIFPVLSKVAANDDRFITLDEGLKAGTVEIMEIGGTAANQTSVQGANQSVEQTTNEPKLPETLPPNPAAQTSAPQVAEENPFGNPFDDPPAIAANTDNNSDDNDPFDSFGAILPGDDDQSAGRDTDPFDEEGADDVQSRAAPQQGLGNLPFGNNGFVGNLSLVDNDVQTTGNEVNRLLVLNKSDKPLYLMPGEIIVGGQQDRTIGEEIVIQPGTKPVPIEVFCVEHGRWQNRGIAQTVADLNVASGNSVRGASVALATLVLTETAVNDAGNQKFIASVGNLSKAGRLVVQQGQGQGEVWEKVRLDNAKAGVKSGSGNFAGNYIEPQAVARLDPYLEKLQASVGDQTQIVGVIVAINGKVDSTDIFESTPLFRKLWPKLLKSYALDAANVAEGENASLACPHQSACEFVHEAMNASEQSSKKKGQIAITTRSNDKVVTFATDGVQGSGAGGAAASIHLNGFAK
jgi:hypothetical protein